MRIRFTRTARKEFLAALEYIREANPRAALRFRQRAEQALRPLSEHPFIGRRIPEFPDLPHREIILAPYRFFYKVEPSCVWIVAVWHGARLPAAPLEADGGPDGEAE